MESKKLNIDRLIDIQMEMACENQQRLDEMLRCEGFDPEKIGKEGLSFIKSQMFKVVVAKNKINNSGLYEKAVKMLREIAVSTVQTKEAILLQLQAKSPRLQFNKLENLTVENLQEILNDTEVLDLMSQLENEHSQ
ncbi:hypothetical protein [Chitinophaga sp. sic0106]|uniref:hypothetical protein n=1 Tax=Chitinophaga sp. sic0106 TaxID=2854785 RepID=UPI001C448D4A|nr:hypothetical protein [Chitinophaga sp. sic0106]MBV7529275.1 hypothetical protein [Chitinophaga sp. sic0106]